MNPLPLSAFVNFPSHSDQDKVNELTKLLTIGHSLNLQRIIFELENLFLNYRVFDNFDYTYKSFNDTTSLSNAYTMYNKSISAINIKPTIYDKNGIIQDTREETHSLKYLLTNIHLSVELKGGLHCFKGHSKKERFNIYRELAKTHKLPDNFLKAVDMMEKNNQQKKPRNITPDFFSKIKVKMINFPILGHVFNDFNNYNDMFDSHFILQDILNNNYNDAIKELSHFAIIKIFYDIGHLLFSGQVDTLKVHDKLHYTGNIEVEAYLQDKPVVLTDLSEFITQYNNLFNIGTNFYRHTFTKNNLINDMYHNDHIRLYSSNVVEEMKVYLHGVEKAKFQQAEISELFNIKENTNKKTFRL